MIDRAQIHGLEERAFNAWPARKTIWVGGWIFRLTDGYTKRANSANPIEPTAPFAEVLEAAESVYHRHGLPAVFRLSPLAPSEADRTLQGRGYALLDPTLVLQVPLLAASRHPAVRIQQGPSADWLEGFAAANRVSPASRPVHDFILRSIAMPAAFATFIEGGQAVGFGLAVYERSMVGLFDIAVTPSKRGRGYGRAITRALLDWGHDAGAEHSYLQVVERNAIARRLYASLGFVEAYRYHYRVPVGSTLG